MKSQESLYKTLIRLFVHNYRMMTSAHIFLVDGLLQRKRSALIELFAVASTTALVLPQIPANVPLDGQVVIVAFQYVSRIAFIMETAPIQMFVRASVAGQEMTAALRCVHKNAKMEDSV